MKRPLKPRRKVDKTETDQERIDRVREMMIKALGLDRYPDPKPKEN